MQDLTTGSVNRHLLKTAGFMLVTMFFQTLYFLVDLYWVGRLGKEAVAAVGLSGNLMFVVLAVTQMLAVGTTTLISHAVGQKDRDRALLVFNQSQVLSVVAGVVFLALALALRPYYARSLSADAATAALASDYLAWFIPASALQFAMVGMGAALRGTGNFKPGMVVQTATVIINIVLAPILIFGWGTGRPLGVAGAALATFIAIAVGSVWLLTYFRRKDAYLCFVPADWKPRLDLWAAMLKVGLPAGAEFGLMSIYLFVVYAITRPFGAAAQAGFGIGMRVLQAGFMPVVALGFAVAPVAGQNFGAHLGSRVRETFRSALIMAVGAMAVFAFLCHIAPAALIGIFSQDPQVIAVGDEYLRIISWNFVASGVIFVASSMGTPLQNEPQVAAFGNTLVAVWYRAVFFRSSGWGLSLDGGGTWTNGGVLPLADPSRDGTWGQSTVCVDRTGRFYAATVYSGDWFGIALYRGSLQAGNLSWEGPLFAIPPTLIPDYNLNRALDAVRLTCDPERGYLYLSYTRSLALAVGQYECTIQFVRSLDGGTAWSAPQVLSSGIASNGSRPAVGPNGELYVVWEDFTTRQVVGRRSADFGTSFGPPFVVGEIRDNLGTLPPEWSDPFWRVNPAVSPPQAQVASDFPSLAVDRSDGPHRGRIYATWTDYAEAVVGPRTGRSNELEPNDWFATATEVTIGQDLAGFVMSLDFGPADGDLYTFTGTAGATIQVSGQVTSVFPTPNEPVWLPYTLLCGPDTLQLTTVSQNLAPWLNPPDPPPTLYTLPADGRYYLGVGSGMRSYGYELSLRAMSPLPGQAAQDHRDIVLTWSDDGGATWSPKRRVGDAPPHYDESFPAVAVDEFGRVHLAWYDRRDDPGCGELVHTYWTFSVDGGASFVAARRLSTQASSWNFINSEGDSNIGDHLGLTTEGGRVHVLWTDTRGADADIYAVRIDDVPTGIAVPRFVAEAADGYIRLAWTVADATGIAGFRLHRAEGESESFEALEDGPQPSRGPGEYQVEDRSVIPGRSYRYRLEVVREGMSGWEGPVRVSLPALIARLAWQGASPNPFSHAVRLELAVPRAGEAWVRVYDLSGHEVTTIHRGAVVPGLKSWTWEGTDQAGRPVAAGVYLLRADLAGESKAKRLVLIR